MPANPPAATRTWLSPTGAGEHGWEEVPYWLKGFGDLGYVLGDKRVIDEARVWIEGALGSQRGGGLILQYPHAMADARKLDAERRIARHHAHRRPDAEDVPKSVRAAMATATEILRSRNLSGNLLFRILLE